LRREQSADAVPGDIDLIWRSSALLDALFDEVAAEDAELLDRLAR
jgi:hypothetical protein